MSTADVDARIRADLRLACLHEYAHLAVARHLGAHGFVTISWSFVAERRGAHHGCRFQLFGDLADDEWRIVALAGTVAELVEDDSACNAMEIFERLRRGDVVLSAIDAQRAAGFELPDVRRCLEIVTRAWPDVDRWAAGRCASAES